MTDIETQFMPVEEAVVIDTYDALADHYDERYDTPVGREEDEIVKGWISSPHLATDHVLDIGCGTGLLLDLHSESVTPDRKSVV